MKQNCCYSQSFSCGWQKPPTWIRKQTNKYTRYIYSVCKVKFSFSSSKLVTYEPARQGMLSLGSGRLSCCIQKWERKKKLKSPFSHPRQLIEAGAFCSSQFHSSFRGDFSFFPMHVNFIPVLREGDGGAAEVFALGFRGCDSF